MHRLHPYPDVQVMFRRLLIATLIGLLAALAVALFRHAMVVLETLLLSNDSGSLVNAAQSLPAWRRLVTPALGGLTAGTLLWLWQRRSVARPHAATDYMEALETGDGCFDTPASLMKSLAAMPVGTIIHNVELKPGKGGQIARSAGAYAQLVGRDQGMAILRLNSGEQRIVHGSCIATVGAVSNPEHGNINDGKAGRSRWRGQRPHNRGVAMNPVDHPHGGGEGRTSGGRHPVTPWGKPTKGKRTRSNKATDKFIMRSRHQRKS